MSDNRPPYHRRQTKPFPRVQLAPVGPAPDPQREVETMVPCPLCGPHGASGMVPATVRAAWSKSAVVSDRELAIIDSADDETEPPEAA